MSGTCSVRWLKRRHVEIAVDAEGRGDAQADIGLLGQIEQVGRADVGCLRMQDADLQPAQGRAELLCPP